MGVVAVVAVEAERLAVQQDLPSGGGDGADAEAFDDRVGGGFQPDRVQLRSCRSPELPSRNGQFQLEAVAVPDRFHRLRFRAVEAEPQRCGTAGHTPFETYPARRRIDGGDPNPIEPGALRQREEFQRTVNAAVPVEVVEDREKRRILKIQPVVDQQDQPVRTGRTGFKFVFHLGIRKLVDADFSIVPQDAAAQAERAEAQQQQRFVGKFDGDPVGGDAPFARVTRGGVETAGTGIRSSYRIAAASIFSSDGTPSPRNANS